MVRLEAAEDQIIPFPPLGAAAVKLVVDVIGEFRIEPGLAQEPL
jgi:hypothetical protein